MEYAQDIIEGYNKIIKKYMNHESVKRRITINIDNGKREVTKEKFWRSLLLGVITSGKRESAVKKLKNLPIFDFNAVSQQKDRKFFFSENLSAFGCQEKFAHYLDHNYKKMDTEWETILKSLEAVKEDTSLEKERNIVLDFQEFLGIGSKQSRNMLQMLGFSQYVIPIDSRIKKGLCKLGGVAMPIDKKSFSNEKIYREVEDQINDLCKKLGIVPCILEACLYLEFEE